MKICGMSVAVTWLEFEVVKGVKWVVTYHSYHW